jgi:hypothetical protein
LDKNESVFQIKGSWRFQGGKKAMKINVSSPFSLCSLNGSDANEARCQEAISRRVLAAATQNQPAR